MKKLKEQGMNMAESNRIRARIAHGGIAAWIFISLVATSAGCLLGYCLIAGSAEFEDFFGMLFAFAFCCLFFLPVIYTTS